MSRAETNHLSIEMSEIKDLRGDSSVFISFCLDEEIFVTNSFKGSSGDLKYFRLIPLVMCVDLDRYLRSIPVIILYSTSR
jgi:hypothetical protein